MIISTSSTTSTGSDSRSRSRCISLLIDNRCRNLRSTRMKCAQVAMRAIPGLRIETGPAALPAAGQAAGHTVLVAAVTLVTFRRVGGDVGELDYHDFRVGCLWR